MIREFIVEFLPVAMIICGCYAPIAIYRDLKEMSEHNSIDEDCD